MGRVIRNQRKGRGSIFSQCRLRNPLDIDHRRRRANNGKLTFQNSGQHSLE